MRPPPALITPPPPVEADAADEELPQLLVIRAPEIQSQAPSPFAAAVPAPPKRGSFLLPLVLGLSALFVAGAVAGTWWFVIRKEPPAVVAAPTLPAQPAPTPAPPPAAPPEPAATAPLAPTTPPAQAHPIVTHPDLPAPLPRPEEPSPPPVVSSACAAGMVEVRANLCIDAYESPGHGLPRTAVSFADAAAACSSRGARLCTDLEWEHGCRGHGGASYPYGNSYDPKRCNTAGSEVKTVGSLAACRSASGAFDMSGNVAEWVTAKGQPAHKGGSSWDGNPVGRCSTTQKNVATGPSPHVGFRCCQTFAAKH